MPRGASRRPHCRDGVGPSDWAATRLAVAIERVAKALLVGSDEQMFGVIEQISGRDQSDQEAQKHWRAIS